MNIRPSLHIKEYYKMNLLRLLLITLLSGPSIAIANADKPRETSYSSFILTGQVYNMPAGGSKTLLVNECDYSSTSVRQVVEFDKEGRFSAIVPINYGHTFTVNYSGNFINAYTEPNDSINIEIDASQSPMSFKLSGSHAELNEEFSHSRVWLTPYLNKIKLPNDTVSISEFMPAFESEVNSLQAIINKYVEENRISDEVADMLRTESLYTISNLASGYRGKGKEDKIAFFTNPIFDLANEKNAKVMIFPYHLSGLLWQLPEYTEQLPKGLLRDIGYVICAEHSETTPERSKFTNTAYFDRVFAPKESTIIEIGDINSSEMIVFEGDSVYNVAYTDPISWLKERFIGRPVYLDISATWCGPCRVAIASSEGVREHFKETDIVFAILWLRSDLEEWKKIVPEIKNAVHVFISDEDTTNQLMGKLNLAGFPSYYLITKNSEIRTDIPNYKSVELPDFLNSLLN